MIQQLDTPQAIYNRPVNRFVAGFIGSPGMNFLDGALDGGSTPALPRERTSPCRCRATGSTTAPSRPRRRPRRAAGAHRSWRSRLRPAVLEGGRGRGRRADGLRHAGLDASSAATTSPFRVEAEKPLHRRRAHSDRLRSGARLAVRRRAGTPLNQRTSGAVAGEPFAPSSSDQKQGAPEDGPGHSNSTAPAISSPGTRS